MMRFRCLQAFAHEGRVYLPERIYAMTPAVASDADHLVRSGVIIVFFDATDPTPLLTPEAGLRLTRRDNAISPVSVTGDSMAPLSTL